MLELRGVTRRYGDKTVLRDISFSLKPGIITLVAGANGSGKSTLLRLMAGLLHPDAGEIISTVPEGKTALLGHQTMLYPELTALENLAFWCRLSGLPPDEDALRGYLVRVNLAREAREKAGTFSRGMAQRLSLARVLLTEPDLLLLDEPGTGLDAASTAILHHEILAARERGAAVVWVSHAVATDLPLADEVILLAKKRLAFHGAAAEFAALPDGNAPEAEPNERPAKDSPAGRRS